MSYDACVRPIDDDNDDDDDDELVYIPAGRLSPKNTTSGFIIPSLHWLHGTGVVRAKRCSGTTMSPSGRSLVFVALVLLTGYVLN